MDKKFLKVLAVFVFALIVIMTHSCVWNSIADGYNDKFFIIPSLINFAAEGLGIYWIIKNWVDKE